MHEDSISVGVAMPGRDEPVYRGETANAPQTIEKWLACLGGEFEGLLLLFCYKARPCGYELYRQSIAAGYGCQSVAPSLI